VKEAAAAVTASARSLLTGIVDYAGLFPPAALGMEEAAAEYARWRRSAEAWMLGRFVLPASRLSELARAASPVLPAGGTGEPWRLSALLGPDARSDSSLVASFNDAHAGRALVDAVETKAATPAEAGDVLETVPAGVSAAVEVPLEADLAPLLTVLRERSARAKVRTGGLVPEAVPDPAALARFIGACAAKGVGWKATAGLHHPVRAERALTYAADSPRAVMHGFLNVFAAAAFVAAGAGASEIVPVLRETDASAFRFDEDALSWRHLRASNADLALSRHKTGASFGSCSFEEPVRGLRALGLIA
jgi:hypothetical protein